MKKFGFLFPVILFLLFSMAGTRLFASGSLNPTMLLGAMAIFFVVMLLLRPKNNKPKPVSDVEKLVRGDFAKDAFADDPKRSAKFQAIVRDYSNNCPKAALSKLEKFAPTCTAPEERYAVAMISAQCYISVGKFKPAIQEYTRALGLHPSSETAVSLGSCQQRMGQLTKAIDSYEFALDLDEKNLDARCKLATALVADGNYHAALDQASLALEQDPKLSSALATCAICYGMLDDAIMRKHYTRLAVENGYDEKKINDTVAALKKR
ncbi:MAG: tetratricopeptide repeat protein [Oscillospiraceae bacterium]|nr:tetratricopeptide repeat protein [Oscillospiraceae bacterium]